MSSSFRSAVSLIENIVENIGLIPLNFDPLTRKYTHVIKSKIKFAIRAVVFNLTMIILTIVSFDMKTIESRSQTILQIMRIIVRMGWLFHDLFHFIWFFLYNDSLIIQMNKLVKITDTESLDLQREYKWIRDSVLFTLVISVIYFGPFLFIIYYHAFGFRVTFEVPLVLNFLIFNGHVFFLLFDCLYMFTIIQTLSIHFNVIIKYCRASEGSIIKEASLKQKLLEFMVLKELLQYIADIAGRQLIPLIFMVLACFASISYFTFELFIDPELSTNGFGNLIVYVVFVNLPILTIFYGSKKLTDTQCEVSWHYFLSLLRFISFG